MLCCGAATRSIELLVARQGCAMGCKSTQAASARIAVDCSSCWHGDSTLSSMLWQFLGQTCAENSSKIGFPCIIITATMLQERHYDIGVANDRLGAYHKPSRCSIPCCRPLLRAPSLKTRHHITHATSETVQGFHQQRLAATDSLDNRAEPLTQLTVRFVAPPRVLDSAHKTSQACRH